MEKTQETFIGIDVCKTSLDIHDLPSNGAWQTENSPAGITELVEKLLLYPPP